MSTPFGSEFGQLETALWNNFEIYGDPVAEALYHEAYFNREGFTGDELSAIRDELRNYLADSYDIDFDATFDWDAWRDAYAGGA